MHVGPRTRVEHPALRWRRLSAGIHFTDSSEVFGGIGGHGKNRTVRVRSLTQVTLEKINETRALQGALSAQSSHARAGVAQPSGEQGERQYTKQ